LGQEKRMHTAVRAGLDCDGSDTAVNLFCEGALVARLLCFYGRSDCFRNLVDRTFLARMEGERRRGVARCVGVEDIALLAHFYVRLGLGHLEMIVAFLNHPPECHMRTVAVPRHIEWRHAERIGLYLEGLLSTEKRVATERIDFL